LTVSLFTVRDSTDREVAAWQGSPRRAADVTVRTEESRVWIYDREEEVAAGYAPPEEPLTLLRAPINETTATVVRGGREE